MKVVPNTLSKTERWDSTTKVILLVPHIFTTSCCTSCREPDIRPHVTDNNTVDRLPVCQNMQVVNKRKLKRVQDSDWLWNLKLLYWKRQAHASFNTFSARWPSLTRNSPKSHAMSAENTEWPLLPYGITKSGGVSCTRKTEFVKLRLSESIVADLTSLVSTNTANLLGHIHNYWTYIILSSN